ncbi:MAG: hypothetical protein M3Y07_15935 [Acidobacteriota bacterium]|nr:hypothetical protein [Acidobacteriota bacterium]
MTAPAAVSWAAGGKSLALHNAPLKFLRSKVSRNIALALAAGELIADKLPSAPNRTSAGSLAARVVSGALCGAAVYSSNRRPIATGALLGGLGAIAGSFAGYEARRRLGHRLEIPDAAIAVLEDGLAMTGGFSIAKHA